MREKERGSHWLVACYKLPDWNQTEILGMCPDWELNLQCSTFWCTGGCSKQLCHPVRAPICLFKCLPICISSFLIGHTCIIWPSKVIFGNRWKYHAWLTPRSHLEQVDVWTKSIDLIVREGCSGANQHRSSMETTSIAKVNYCFLYFIPLAE